MAIFSRPGPVPPSNPTDEIIPAHPLDNGKIVRGMVLEFAYRFDDVLDFKKLQVSFDRLLQIGEWRKLGARLRIKVSPPLSGSQVHLRTDRNVMVAEQQRSGISYSTAIHH
jgi:hypothetical protein